MNVPNRLEVEDFIHMIMLCDDRAKTHGWNRLNANTVFYQAYFVKSFLRLDVGKFTTPLHSIGEGFSGVVNECPVQRN